MAKAPNLLKRLPKKNCSKLFSATAWEAAILDLGAAVLGESGQALCIDAFADAEPVVGELVTVVDSAGDVFSLAKDNAALWLSSTELVTELVVAGALPNLS